MTQAAYNGVERREFARLSYSAPLNLKVCKQETIARLLSGYASDISRAGLLFNTKERVSPDDILWLNFDRSTLEFCQELEKNVLIYQNGIIGKVARIEQKGGTYDIGVRFITREEKNSSYIYPKIYFLFKELEMER